MKTIKKIAADARSLITIRNIQIALAIATMFGVVAPEKATFIRNTILAPLGATQSTGDLL